ncbi:MAG: hypothetical protein NT121_07480 [Chloroflexi bacterium]|nr:hypothetical protein [Chloroflexota bacterium]
MKRLKKNPETPLIPLPPNVFPTNQQEGRRAIYPALMKFCGHPVPITRICSILNNFFVAFARGNFLETNQPSPPIPNKKELTWRPAPFFVSR